MINYKISGSIIMSKFVLKRILLLVPTLLAIIFIVFIIMNITPGDPGRTILGATASQEAVDQLNQTLGINDPLLVRYARYVFNLCKGDMGNSYRTGRAALLEVTQRFPLTFMLAFFSIFFALLLGIPIGILSAVKQYSVLDITTTTTAMFMASMPGFFFGMLMMLLFSLKLRLLPSNGVETWKGYILPIMTVTFPETAVMMRITRTTILETIRKDYIRTARAKGTPERKVIFRHALKNALLPIIATAGSEFGVLLGGVVTTEAIFSLDGTGSLILTSIRAKDIPQVTACAIILAFFYMIIMLLVDILYAYIDPRVKARYQRG